MGQTRRQRPLRAMTKSPVALAREALRVGRAGPEACSSHLFRKDFTQPQWFAILMLRQFFKTDYRGIVQMLQDFLDLRSALGLQKVPHYSTLCYAEARLQKRAFARLLTAVFQRAGQLGLIAPKAEGAMDATGLESHHVSAYFVERRGYRHFRRRRWPKTRYRRQKKRQFLQGVYG